MKVLLVAYETETYSLAHVANELVERGHEVKMLVGDPTNFLNETDFTEYLSQQGFDGWETFKEVYERFQREGEPDVDWEYLEQFEREYCVQKTLNQLVLTDPIIARHHHFRRPYYTPLESEASQYRWVELLLRWIEREFTAFDPDVVFNYRRNYFVKNVVAQLALSRDVPLRTLIHSRVENYHLLCRNFGYGTDPYIREQLRTPPEPDGGGERYVEEFKQEAGRPLYQSRSQDRIAGGNPYPVTETLKQFLRNSKRLLGMRLRNEKKDYAPGRKGNPFDSYPPAVFAYQARLAVNRLRYNYTDRFAREVPDRRFIYFPLHTIPESSTLTLSTEYFETDIIRFISNKLPAGMLLAVKENPNMIGERPWSFYDELEALPNVRLVDPTVSSRSLILESRGVAGISGTALFEAIMLDKPTHAFGVPEFVDFVDSTGWDGFTKFVSRCRAEEGAAHRELTKSYLSYVLEEGIEVPDNSLQRKPNAEEAKSLLATLTDRVIETVATERDGASDSKANEA